MTDPNTTTQTTGAASAPSSYEELVRTLRHASDAHGDSATADLLTEAALALDASSRESEEWRQDASTSNACAQQAYRRLEHAQAAQAKAEAERDAAVARAEAAEALRHSLRRKREALCQEMAEYEDPELKEAYRAKVAGLSIAIRGLDEALTQPSGDPS